MSSDTVAGPTPAAYAFEQLESSKVLSSNAADLVESAWAEAEQIRENARRAGYADGQAAGIAAARGEIESALAALSTALGAFAALREELTTALEHDAADLAFRLCEQVLAGALDVQPERVTDVARNALRRITDRRRVVLLVNPSDLDVISGAIEDLKRELGGIEHCDVQSDRRIDRGGVILRTDAGEIDVTIDAQLERAREIVAEMLQVAPDVG
jgi:flagellar assembly protein FliH